jgi:uridylate kinase
MAKAIDGVYDSDPKKNPNAKKFETLAVSEIVDNKLGVIDLTSAVLCLENKMPLLIFSLNEENSIVEAAMGKSNGTVITV